MDVPIQVKFRSHAIVYFFLLPPSKMPQAPATETRAEPRRSSRIKEQPKFDLPKRAPPKPRVKKAAPKVTPPAECEPAKDELASPKHKSSRGKKRTTEEVNGPEEPAEKPLSKKVRPCPRRPSTDCAYQRVHHGLFVL